MEKNMATSQLISDFRSIIADEPLIGFNETTSDGENASWRLTNSPIEIASESVFVSGILQQDSTELTSAVLINQVGEGEFEFNVGSESSQFTVNDFVTLEDVPDPYKFKITSIDDDVLTINRSTDQTYLVGAQFYSISKDYTIDYDNGILYFNAAWEIGTIITVKFKYTRHSTKTINSILDAAINDVSRDINEEVALDNEKHSSLVLLRAKILLTKRELIGGAASAIKIKQGSTSLDLTGSSDSRTRQIRSDTDDYQIALERYLNNLFDDAAGFAIVGREGYLGV
jgi:hypothetical protein